jgi:hypothetical protein
MHTELGKLKERDHMEDLYNRCVDNIKMDLKVSEYEEAH